MQPEQPLGQLVGDREAPRQLVLQGNGSLQGKLPTPPGRQPTTAGAQGAELGLGDRIEGADHLNQAGGAQPHLDRRLGQAMEVQSRTQ